MPAPHSSFLTGPSASFRRALLAWFRPHARVLPWRKTRDPYAIWVSEVMLQQTQVATVIPYYVRFLRAFPTVRRLARARRERVLELWSGLGYYRRARYLHRAAQDVVRRHRGRFPTDYAGLRSLPGVGDYTARAVLSIAYNLPYAVLDGNVARVVARLAALRGNFSQPRFRRAIEQHLERLLSRPRPGDFNQALMELGQTVCLPRSPRCADCPLAPWCQAYRRGTPESYPDPRPRRVTELRFLATAVLRCGRQVLMLRGLDEGLLGDLWNFPAAFGKSRAAALVRLREKLSTFAPTLPPFGGPVAELKHGITYRSIRVLIFSAEVESRFTSGTARWFSLARLDQSAVSQLARKIAARL